MYNIIIAVYAIGVWVASWFSSKVRKMIVGQRETNRILRENIGKDDRVVWFHAASLGEFEQGRPIMERVRKFHPEYKILLTFFSPSGYEVRKDYKGADVICYLPFDVDLNVHLFLKYAHPEIALFIKYEFWYEFLSKSHKRGVKLYSVSSIFRPNQYFFNKLGRYHARALYQFDHFFVQNQESKELLASIGIKNVSVTGDTRFDRVLDIRNASADLPFVQQFCHGRQTFIAGSSWEPDEDIYIPYFARHRNWKIIIAPHVIGENHLKRIEKQLEDNGFSYVRYTDLEGRHSASLRLGGEADVLIVDCFGKLSSIYRYATVALVGGGFGAGIHNVPEAAVYGIPVMFGPNNKKFLEAQELLKAGASFEYIDAESFAQLMDRFIKEPKFLQEAGEKAAGYIKANSGAADMVYQHVFGKPVPDPS